MNDRIKNIRITPGSTAWKAIIAILVAGLVLIGLLGAESDAGKTIVVLKYLSLLLLVTLLVYKYLLRYVKNYNYNVYNELPLYLCSMTIIVSCLACIFNNRYMMGYCCSVGVVGAFLAIMMPDPDVDDIPLFSLITLGFYGIHICIIWIGFAYLATGLYKPLYNDVYNVTLITIILVAISHIGNLLLSKSVYPEANYNFTMGPKNVGILQLFYKIIPYRFFYLIFAFAISAFSFLVICFLSHLV